MPADPIITADQAAAVITGWTHSGAFKNPSLERLFRSHETLRAERDALLEWLREARRLLSVCEFSEPEDIGVIAVIETLCEEI